MTIPVTDHDGVRTRQAERADLFDVVRIEKDSFPQPWPFHAFERFVDEPGFLVAVVDGGAAGATGRVGPQAAGGEAVVGYVVADTVPNVGGTLGHVKDLAVHPDYRGRGIGRTLLDRALATLRAQDARRTKLEVRESNDRARSLYRGFWFTLDHTIADYYEDGEDALVLVTDLDG